MHNPQPDTDDLVAMLRERGQRVTSPRLAILRELRRRARHATAQEIAEAVRDDLPGISTPTIYATLDLLAELGLARKIDPGVGVSYYDARADAHQHMVCRSCGTVEDVDVELPAQTLWHAARASGFAPERAELVISGLCARCAAGGEPPP